MKNYITLVPVSGIKATFEAMDLNHDGKLSANELRRACKQLGILLTKDELHEIIMEADTSRMTSFFISKLFNDQFIHLT